MDNLKTLEQLIEQHIDPNGAPGSILASNHQAILKQVLAKVGKFTGSAFTARKNATTYPAGTFSWNGNALNNSNQFVITTSKNTADLNDFGLVLGTMGNGDIIRFKDYVGRSVMLTYNSHVAGQDGNGNPIWNITVTGFESNPNYIFQDAETAIAVVSVNKTIGIKQEYVDGQDDIFLQLSKDYTDALINANKQPFIETKSLNWDGVGLTFDPIVKWWFPQTSPTPFQKTENITLDASDPILDRIDVIAVDNTGDIVVIKGTPSADPAEPNVNPDTQLKAWFVIVQAGATTPSGITRSTIYNENTQVAGNEWNTSENTSGARIQLESVSDFYSGTKSIEWTAVELYDGVTFTAGSPIPIADFPETGIHVKNKDNTNPADPFRIQVFGNRSNGNEIVAFLPLPSASGYDPTSVDWQKLGFQVNQNTSMVEVTKIRLVNYVPTAGSFGCFFDLISFSGGTVTPPATGGTEISVRDEAGTEQFKVTDVLQFSGVDFEPGSKRIKVTRKLKEIPIQTKSQLTAPLPAGFVYVLDGDFTLLTGEFINVPAGGLSLTGYGFDISRVTKDVAGESIFKSETGGSGNVILKDTQFTSGAGSVFNLTDVDGSHAIEFNDVNFIGCASLGILNGYRQFTGTTCGIYVCSDGLTLAGEWSGFKLTNTNVFSFGSAGTLLKAGTGLTFSGRFYIELNVDFPAGAKLSDFNSANFLDKELFQINSTIAKVDGVLDDTHANTLVPNIKANNEKCLWRSNVGLPDSALEKFVNDDDIAGTYDINWLMDTYFLTMTADTVFTESNLPANLKNTEEIKIYLSGNFKPTFVPAWLTNVVGTFKPGEINQITLKFIKTGVYFMKIDNSLTVYPAPSLGSVVPAGLYPSQTQSLVLNGSFFTPASVVEIEGQTVNSVTFNNDTGALELSVTTGATEGDFDIFVSNGTGRMFSNRLVIALGDVFIPSENDWTEVSNLDVGESGKVKIVTYDLNGNGKWPIAIDPSKNWEIRWQLEVSPLGDLMESSGQNNLVFQVIKNSGTFMFRQSFHVSNVGNYFIYGGTPISGNQFIVNTPSGTGTANGAAAVLETFTLKLKWINNVLTFYVDNSLKKTYTDVVDEQCYISIVNLRRYNIRGIKYIELA